MDSDQSLADLKAMLKAIRTQIELLEGQTTKGPDKELRKRLKKAKNEESVLLSKLREMESVE
jgi:rubrerythrin